MAVEGDRPSRSSEMAMSSGLKSFASRDNLIHELLVSRTAPRRSRDEPANDLPTVQPTRESLARE